MKYEPRKVFIKINGIYTELTYQEFCNLKRKETSYANKHFIPVQGMLLEVDEENYKDFYRDKERNRYLKKIDIENNLCSIDALDNEDNNGIDFIPDTSKDIAEVVSDKLMLNKLRECLFLLPDEEKELICQHYYEEMTEVELSKLYGISQQSVSKRLKKIREKLKGLMEKWR